MRGILSLCAGLLGLLAAFPASAQNVQPLGNVVSSCGTPNGAAYTVGQNRPTTVDPNANTCMVAASLPLPANAAQETGGNLAAIAGAVGSTGSAVPSKAYYLGAVSSGNLTGIIQADNSAAINVSTATTTQIVALAAGKKIYITALDILAGGTGNITFEYGTGTNCAGGTTVLTGAYNLIAQTGLTKGSGLGPILVIPASNALCVLTSAAVQMSGSVAYTQF